MILLYFSVIRAIYFIIFKEAFPMENLQEEQRLNEERNFVIYKNFRFA